MYTLIFFRFSTTKVVIMVPTKERQRRLQTLEKSTLLMRYDFDLPDAPSFLDQTSLICFQCIHWILPLLLIAQERLHRSVSRPEMHNEG